MVNLWKLDCCKFWRNRNSKKFKRKWNFGKCWKNRHFGTFRRDRNFRKSRNSQCFEKSGKYQNLRKISHQLKCWETWKDRILESSWKNWNSVTSSECYHFEEYRRNQNFGKSGWNEKMLEKLKRNLKILNISENIEISKNPKNLISKNLWESVIINR